MTDTEKLDGLTLVSSKICGVSPHQIGARYEYLIEAIKTMANAMDNELTGEILRELMRAKARIEEWESA